MQRCDAVVAKRVIPKMDSPERLVLNRVSMSPVTWLRVTS